MQKALGLLLVAVCLLVVTPAVSAQEADADGGLPDYLKGREFERGEGFYFSPFKLSLFIVSLGIWVGAVHWVDADTKKLELSERMWNPAVFFSGLAGALLMLVIPIFELSIILFWLALGVPAVSYVAQRNQVVAEEAKVLTPFHLKNVLARYLAKIGVRLTLQSGDGKSRGGGPPIQFVGKSRTGEEDMGRVRNVEKSGGYLAAKELVYDAIIRRATDVHLEPHATQLSVRYRIDGIMHNSDPFPRDVGDAIINVMKVLCNLDITERRKPQDGSFGARLEGRELDFRVATAGSVAGEKLVMRILDRDSAVIDLENLGMGKKMRDRVRGVATQPQGMFIVCGPTGAGKSTTLYACLRQIDAFQSNIITLEDPVEYQLNNVTQQEIDTKAGMSFAKALRSVLRQDPDVIMIGEIRDGETAGISMQAATTGHMVFSTLHANDTITALYRLIDLGVETYMLSTALSALMSQRLVRVLCDECKQPYRPKPEFLRKANLPADKIDVFYRPPDRPEKVCRRCGGTGYFGRVGIFEFLVITDHMRDLIREKASVNAIKAEARKSGMLYLQEEGLKKVIRGATSIQELMRVIR